jgi:cell wall-associated NlpC family hydrolase
LFVFLGLAIALVFVTGISAGAEPDGSIRAKKADVAAAQDRLVEIRLEASSAEAAYNNALYEMNQLNGQITSTTEDLGAAKERLAVAKETLEERAAQVYKSGNVAFMDVLVGVDNFSEFASRLNLWVRLLDRERAEFLEVREARNELAARRDRLEAQREQRVAAVETAIAQRERANEAKARAEAYLNSLNAELRDAIQAAQDRQAAQARAAAATMVEKAPEPVEEPEPIPEVQVKQARVPRADLQSERAAAERQAAARAASERAERLAERRAAEREAARKAAKQAAAEREAARLAAAKAARQEAREEAQRQAELAAQRAAERQAAREEAERQAELAARRAKIEEAAAEQAAAERRAARLAAERRAERRAADRRAEERAAERAEASASASAAAERKADRRAERRAEASGSASASAPSSNNSGRGGGGHRGGSAGDSSASATASASASGSRGGGGVSASGDDVLAVADDHLGTPYVFSPPGPCVAFEAEDCSCFTMLVFQEFGIALPDSPGGQMGYGTPVHGAPQAGDLLFWSEDGSGYITHVGIAMGDGTTIHAQVHNEVTITSINYVEGYVGARRLL